MTDSTFVLEMIRQLSERIGRLESQQVWLLGMGLFTLGGVLINILLHMRRNRKE